MKVELEYVISRYIDNPLLMAPAVTLYCSLRDWQKFLKMHLEEGRDGRVLNKETLNVLHTSDSSGVYTYGSVLSTRTANHTVASKANYWKEAWITFSSSHSFCSASYKL